MPLNLKERIEILSQLGQQLQAGSERMDAVIQKSYINNQWFTPENSRHALQRIAENYLQKEKLEVWTGSYNLHDVPTPLRIGLIMAGNIPVVGFHDLLCVFIAGYISKIKLSEKDKYFIPFLIEEMTAINPKVQAYFQIVERLHEFDAVIATGSDNSARYFEQYFGKYPHIIRSNRHAVAVLTGNESSEELIALGSDVFKYFGLGCRNVSKLYVPEGYDFDNFLRAMHTFNEIVNHNKYKNNFDYNFTLFILNKIPHLANGCILLREDESLSSRIASLHYEYYKSEQDLLSKLHAASDQIQCIATQMPIESLPAVAFGEAQKPSLSDYADGVDTIQFLLQING